MYVSADVLALIASSLVFIWCLRFVYNELRYLGQ